MVDFLNKGLIARYNSAYADYVTNMQSGQNVPPERRHAPVPPMGWELAQPNQDGFVFYQIGTTPVCPQKPDVTANFDNPQPTKDPTHIHVGSAIPGGGGMWFSVGGGDGTPNGFHTPPLSSDDGVFGVFVKFSAPVGPGWYLKSA